MNPLKMRTYKFYRTFVFVTICFILFLIYLLSHRPSRKNAANLFVSKLFSKVIKKNNNRSDNIIQTEKKIILSLVACDSRLNESLNMIKSVLIFTKTSVHFVIFADDILQPEYEKKLNKWRGKLKNSFSFQLEHIKFPENHNKEWLHLFNKCSAQRLFMPNLLPDIDSMIYLDTDTLFLGPVDMLWHFFKKFNSTQISALTLEDANPNVSWYPRFAKHPYYGNVGVNSGVMLMNLTRMRNSHWENLVTPIMLKYKLSIPWGDQDIINVIFHYHPEWVLVLPCEYNFRTEQCAYGPACSRALVLHGSRRAFHTQHQPPFQAVYQAIDEYEIGTDRRLFAVRLQQYLENAAASNCGSQPDIFISMSLMTLDILRDSTNKNVKT